MAQAFFNPCFLKGAQFSVRYRIQKPYPASSRKPINHRVTRDSLEDPDQYHQIVRGRVFCDRYLHGRRNLSSNPMNDFRTGMRTTTDDIIYPLFLANSIHFSIFHDNKDENGSLKQNRDRGFASA